VLPHWTYDIANQPEAQRKVDMSRFELNEQHLEEDLQIHHVCVCLCVLLRGGDGGCMCVAYGHDS